MAHPSTPTADWSALKYDVASQSALLHLLDAAAAFDLPASVAASVTAFALRGLVLASLARSTVLGRNTAPAGRLSASLRLIMTRLFLGPSHRVSFVRSLSGVSASAAFARTLPAPICPLFDSSDYSAVFRLRHLKPTHCSASSSRMPLTSIGPSHALPPGVWSHFHCSSP